jgi:oligoribonuclease (3'-5' exoribonuclease)
MVDQDALEQLIKTTAQATVEAVRSLNILTGLDRYIFTIKTPLCGISIQVDRNGMVKIFRQEREES